MEQTVFNLNGKEVVLLVIHEEDYDVIKAVPVAWYKEKEEELNSGYGNPDGSINAGELSDELNEEIDGFEDLNVLHIINY